MGIKVRKIERKVVYTILNAADLAIICIQLLECVAIVRFPCVSVIHIITERHHQRPAELVPQVHLFQLCRHRIVTFFELLQVYILGIINAIRHHNVTERAHVGKILDQPPVIVRNIEQVLAHLP